MVATILSEISLYRRKKENLLRPSGSPGGVWISSLLPYCFSSFHHTEYQFIGPVCGPVIVEGKAVVLGHASAGCQFKGLAALVNSEAKLECLVLINA